MAERRTKSRDEVTFFETVEAFRAWLAVNHGGELELWVGFFKKGTGIKSITYREAVDEALCHGWIDGVRHSIDEESYANRFTPRRKGSNWSAINVKRIQELMEAGRMAPPGIAAFEARDPWKTQYSNEREAASLSDEYEALLKGSERAWAFFREQTPWYRRTASFWVVSAKQEETRRRRLGQLIEDSEAGLWIKALRSAQRGTRR
jgi:uncharacterized protein YdeI (YjbR/CyaY-like superfamily)